MYKTTPYFIAGIGANTHIRYSYEIDDKELRIIDRLGGTDAVSLPPTSVNIQQTLGQKLLSVSGMVVGDVVVYKQGRDPIRCNNIKDPFNFKAALYGNHPDVQPIKPVELESFVLCIPQMPQTLDAAMFALCENSLQFNGDFVKVGQMVKRGDPVTLSGEPIVAPVDGKIIRIGAMNVRSIWNKGEKWPTYTGMDSNNPVTRDFFETRFKIQPARGSNLGDSISYAYHKVFAGFERGYANPAPIVKRLSQGGESYAERSVATKKAQGYEAIEMLQSAKYKTQAIDPAGVVADTMTWEP